MGFTSVLVKFTLKPPGYHLDFSPLSLHLALGEFHQHKVQLGYIWVVRWLSTSSGLSLLHLHTALEPWGPELWGIPKRLKLLGLCPEAKTPEPEASLQDHTICSALIPKSLTSPVPAPFIFILFLVLPPLMKPQAPIHNHTLPGGPSSLPHLGLGTIAPWP